MIPSETIKILGSTRAQIEFDREEDYVVPGIMLEELEALMRRLFRDQKIGSDEMRDWANLLHVRLKGLL